MKFLGFRLSAPMQAWGDVATGEHRPTRAAPTKSGITGLVASALGIGRDDAAELDAVSAGYGMATRTDRGGVLLEDYHTVGMAEVGKRDAARMKTRRDEVEHPAFATKYLSRRGYLCDAVFTVLLWERGDDAPYLLEEIAAALETPAWPLFLGRRCCPSSPLSPQIVEAETIRDAFDALRMPLVGLAELSGDGCPVQWDDDPGVPAGIAAKYQTQVRDSSINRTAWMFTDRAVNLGSF